MPICLFEHGYRRLRSLFIEEVLLTANIALATGVHRRLLDIRFEGAGVPSGQLMRLLQDYDTVRDGFGAAAVSLLADLPFLALFLFGLFWCDPGIAGAVLLINGVVIGLAVLTMRHQAKVYKEMSRWATARAQAAHESLLDPEMARRVNAANYLHRRFRQATAVHATTGQAIRRLAALRGHIAALSQSLTLLATLGLGAWHAIDGGLSPGVILAATMLATRFTGAAMQMAGVVPQALSALTALAVMRDLMARPTERPLGQVLIHKPLCRGDLMFEAVTARYPGMRSPAVDDVSFTVQAGGRLAVTGPSGLRQDHPGTVDLWHCAARERPDSAGWRGHRRP
ncbi:MAG: ABC-type protease/lipase transport system ATPase and permease component [Rhodospirillaceae bacterium]|nr:MAG: ABC-type protease/lipase transport system ATPase and permease component [Rhodospirillaceae bacterium]